MDSPERVSGATGLLAMTEDDLRRIVATVVEAMAPRKPERPRGIVVLRSWIAPLAGFLLLFTTWVLLTHWRPPITPRARATSLPTVELLDHPVAGRDVRLRITGAQAQALTVTGPQTISVPIDLPLPATGCNQMARELGGQCAAAIGTVLIPGSVTVAWDAPQPLLLDPVQPNPANPRPLTMRALRVGLANPPAPTTADGGTEPAAPGDAAGSAGRQVSIWADTTGKGQRAQRWCYQYGQAAPATLTITAGDRVATRAFDRTGAPSVGCDGLQLLVTGDQSVAGTRPVPPLVTLGGVGAIQIHTESAQLNISHLTGNLVLEEDRIKVFETPTAAALRAGSIATDLNLAAGSASLALIGHGVTSIDTGEGNLVRTAWQRQKELIVPIFLGLVGLMTPLLGAAYKNSFDYLVGEPKVFRRVVGRLARWAWAPFAAFGRLLARPFAWMRRRRRPPGPPASEAA